MNKEQLVEILQSCLLSYEGIGLNELSTYMNPQNVAIGVKMKEFLESKVKSLEITQ